jgi:hypothetical protein
MKDQVVDYGIAALDATTLQVLNQPGRSAIVKDAVARPSVATKCPWGAGTAHVLI